MYDQFEALSAEWKLSEKDQEPAAELAEKLERFKAILKKKDDKYRETKTKLDDEVNATELVKEENRKLKDEIRLNKECEECNLQGEVVTRQTARLVERDNEVDKLKFDLNSAKKLNDKNAKEKKEHNESLDKVRKDNGKLTKDNQNLKFELENKESMIRSLKETYGIDDEEHDMQEEIEEDPEDTEEVPENRGTSTASMDNDTSGNKCIACNKTYKTNKDLENHMNAKHTQKQCVLCDKICASETELVRHHTHCLQQGINTVVCSKCNKNFTSFGLRRHKTQCKGLEAQFECSDCGKAGKSKEEIRKHINDVHVEERVRSREVCYHWRNGHCTKGDRCGFSHVGTQKGSHSTQINITREKPVEMVKGVSGRRGASLCSTSMELVYKSPKKCTMCKEIVDNKARVIEHSHKEHIVKNSVATMKDVSTSPAVISPIQ